VEEQRQAIVNKKNEVDEELKEARNRVESLKDEMNSYRQTVASIFTKATEILKGNMSTLSEINQDASETEGIIVESKEKAELQEFKVDNKENNKIEVEQFMKKFFSSISSSQDVYLKQIQRLHTRIQQLEKSVQLEKGAHVKQIDVLLKVSVSVLERKSIFSNVWAYNVDELRIYFQKCRQYSKLIKKLNLTMSEMMNSKCVEESNEINDEQKITTTVSEVQTETSPEEKLKWYKLKENHDFFETILREIDDTLGEEIHANWFKSLIIYESLIFCKK